jgi:ribosomal protein S18 acetylase RimI-like enzyme
MDIQEVPYIEAPIELLLEADPSRDKLNAYLPHSICFVAKRHDALVGAYVVQGIAPGIYELMSIAVSPEKQRNGIGTILLKHAVETVGDLGARRLEVGTGSFGYQLAWYQREGFRVLLLSGTSSLRIIPSQSMNTASSSKICYGLPWSTKHNLEI